MDYYKPYNEPNDASEYGEITKTQEEYLVNGKVVENNRAINGDIVYINDGKVINIKQRTNTFIVGILHLNTNQKYGFTKRNIPLFKFTSISNKYPNFIVPSKSREKKALYCVIQLNKWETNNKQPIGKIEKIIGPVGDINNEIDMLLYHTQIYPKKNKTKYIKDVEVHNTCDYHTFSIDPPGCKDIDDALHYKENSDTIEIGIHIANVARYIDIIDTNIYSSIYLNNKQINMLKDDITFNQCSLGDSVYRKSLSLILTYKDYKLVNTEFKECIVRNTALTYEKVDKIIKYNIRHEILDLYNFTKKIQKSDSIPATKMVEFYMLKYNNICAETLYKYNPKTILRTHKNIETEFNNLSLDLKLYLHRINQNAAQYISDPEDTYHRDLDLQYYTHATSPIRRYVDIINQLNIIRLLENKDIIIKDNLDSVNIFQKKLRKFYNYNKKLNLIFNMSSEETHDAFIISKNNLKLKVYIPSLDIEHGFMLLSNKLIESNDIIIDNESITINNVKFSIYDKIKILVTPLKYEEKFNKKLHIKVLEPSFTIS
jgi:exoribonuclease R